MDRAARVRAALLDPAAVFGSPEEVERDASLREKEKLAILESWEEDAHDLAVAEDEGMGGGERSRLEEVVAARMRLTGAMEMASEEQKKAPASKASGTRRVRRLAKPVREIIHADHEMDEAALRLSLQEHPVLPVIDADQIVGILARTELAEAAEKKNENVRITARVMMTTDLAFCYLDDDVSTARALMDRHGCNHLLVVDREQVLVGTLERADLPASEGRAESSEVLEPREEETQGVANTIQPGGLEVYHERPKIKAPHS